MHLYKAFVYNVGIKTLNTKNVKIVKHNIVSHKVITMAWDLSALPQKKF